VRTATLAHSCADFVNPKNLTAIQQNGESFDTLKSSPLIANGKTNLYTYWKGGVCNTTSISKVNATIYEGRAHLSDTISKLNACRNEGVLRALCCIVGGLASAARNATKIAGDMAREAQQFSQASSNIPIDV